GATAAAGRDGHGRGGVAAEGGGEGDSLRRGDGAGGGRERGRGRRLGHGHGCGHGQRGGVVRAERDGAAAAGRRLSQGDGARGRAAGVETRRIADERGHDRTAAPTRRRGFEGRHLGQISVGAAVGEGGGDGPGRSLDRVLGGDVHAVEGRTPRESGPGVDRGE